jgi:hypothetical protein
MARSEIFFFLFLLLFPLLHAIGVLVQVDGTETPDARAFQHAGQSFSLLDFINRAWVPRLIFRMGKPLQEPFISGKFK